MLQACVIHCQGTRLQIIELCQRGKKVVELQRSHFDLFTPLFYSVHSTASISIDEGGPSFKGGLTVVIPRILII